MTWDWTPFRQVPPSPLPWNWLRRALLNQSQCEGLELNWGNYHAVIELLQRIAVRQGFLGDLLAEGAARAARWLGGGAER